jgi:hypothetical protein
VGVEVRVRAWVNESAALPGGRGDDFGVEG